MRGITLLSTMLALALSAPAAAVAQTPAPTGGAAYDENAPDPTKPVVEGTTAVRLDDGRAAAPSMAPPQVQEAIWAADEIIGKPYSYGGGHNRTFKSSGYDCSGTVSYALHGGGLLKSPLDSGSFMSWGKARKGQWITVYANSGHAYAVIAGLRLDTSAAGEPVSSGKGPRWRSTARKQAGYTARHPVGF
ncbi:MAG: hypothetical protein QOE86_2611 [Solirubrobacteraceae bacterium]|nr:hypothetical protein [Solirubrobacteraceae bacterium]